MGKAVSTIRLPSGLLFLRTSEINNAGAPDKHIMNMGIVLFLAMSDKTWFKRENKPLKHQ